MDYLNALDTKIFLYLNSLHNPFFDFLMYWLSDQWIWIPMYLIITLFIVKRYRLKGLIMILFIALAITICDQTASGILKNIFHRLRPSHEPELKGLIHLSVAGPGGMYGFASSHAANAFGFATFMRYATDDRDRYVGYWLVLWAILVSYSRVYNGVHYPSDVLAGATIGFVFGRLISKLYIYCISILSKKPIKQNNQSLRNK